MGRACSWNTRKPARYLRKGALHFPEFPMTSLIESIGGRRLPLIVAISRKNWQYRTSRHSFDHKLESGAQRGLFRTSYSLPDSVSWIFERFRFFTVPQYAYVTARSHNNKVKKVHGKRSKDHQTSSKIITEHSLYEFHRFPTQNIYQPIVKSLFKHLMVSKLCCLLVLSQKKDRWNVCSNIFRRYLRAHAPYGRLHPDEPY